MSSIPDISDLLGAMSTEPEEIAEQVVQTDDFLNFASLPCRNVKVTSSEIAGQEEISVMEAAGDKDYRDAAIAFQEIIEECFPERESSLSSSEFPLPVVLSAIENRTTHPDSEETDDNTPIFPMSPEQVDSMMVPQLNLSETFLSVDIFGDQQLPMNIAHEDGENMVFDCPLCGKMLKDLADLIAHEKFHAITETTHSEGSSDYLASYEANALGFESGFTQDDSTGSQQEQYEVVDTLLGEKLVVKLRKVNEDKSECTSVELSRLINGSPNLLQTTSNEMTDSQMPDPFDPVSLEDLVESLGCPGFFSDTSLAAHLEICSILPVQENPNFECVEAESKLSPEIPTQAGGKRRRLSSSASSSSSLATSTGDTDTSANSSDTSQHDKAPINNELRNWPIGEKCAVSALKEVTVGADHLTESPLLIGTANTLVTPSRKPITSQKKALQSIERKCASALKENDLVSVQSNTSMLMKTPPAESIFEVVTSNKECLSLTSAETRKNLVDGITESSLMSTGASIIGSIREPVTSQKEKQSPREKLTCILKPNHVPGFNSNKSRLVNRRPYKSIVKPVTSSTSLTSTQAQKNQIEADTVLSSNIDGNHPAESKNTNGEPIVCTNCNAVFATKKTLRRHLKNMICADKSERLAKFGGKYSCGNCSLTFLTVATRNNHLRYSNSCQKFAASQRPILSCPICNNLFVRKYSLNMHMKGKQCRNAQCNSCGCMFTPKLLERHSKKSCSARHTPVISGKRTKEDAPKLAASDSHASRQGVKERSEGNTQSRAKLKDHSRRKNKETRENTPEMNGSANGSWVIAFLKKTEKDARKLGVNGRLGGLRCAHCSVMFEVDDFPYHLPCNTAETSNPSAGQDPQVQGPQCKDFASILKNYAVCMGCDKCASRFNFEDYKKHLPCPDNTAKGWRGKILEPSISGDAGNSAAGTDFVSKEVHSSRSRVVSKGRKKLPCNVITVHAELPVVETPATILKECSVALPRLTTEYITKIKRQIKFEFEAEKACAKLARKRLSLKCVNCQAVFTKPRSLVHHTQNELCAVICDICSRKFYISTEAQHKQLRHGIQRPEHHVSGRTCICGRVFKVAANFEFHARHCLQCPSCSKYFQSKHYMHLHFPRCVIQLTPLAAGMACQHCNRTLVSVQHAKKHGDVNPARACNLCKNEFCSEKDALEHLIVTKDLLTCKAAGQTVKSS